MVEKLNAKQNTQLNNYLRQHPKTSRNAAIQLLFGNKGRGSVSSTGLTVDHNTKDASKPQTIYLQSGRKVVYTRTKDGKLVCKYYGADGTQIKPEYFKKVEGNISIAADNASYTVTKNGKSVKYKAKDSRKGQIDQNIVKLNNQEKSLKRTKKEQGFIGKSWDWFKNTSVGQFLNLDGSDKAQKQIDEERKLLIQLRDNPDAQIDPKKFEKVTGQKYTKANLTKFQQGEFSSAKAKVDGYKEGQATAVDVASDIGSGIVSFGVYAAAIAAAPATGGASIVVGFAAAGVAGAVTKVAIKAADTIGTNRKYDFLSKEAASDAFMGGVNGLVAPLTAGVGGAVAKTFAIRAGFQVVKETGKQTTKLVFSQATKNAAKQGFGRVFKSQLKESLINPTYKLVGGTFGKRLVAYGAEGAVDGALSGGAYSGVETAKDGGSAGDILKATALGFGTGAIMGGIMSSAAHGKGLVTGNKGGTGISQHDELSMITGFKNLTVEEKKLLAKYNIYSSSGGQKSDLHPVISMKKKNPHPTNLTNEMKRSKYRRQDIAKLFEDNPNLSRTVGALPRSWGKKLGGKDNFIAIDKCFANFALARKNGNANAVQDLQQNLSKILGCDVQISYTGRGDIGTVHKLTVNGQSFALKTFFKLEGQSMPGHGNWDELASAVYASDKTKNAAKFYMGKFGEQSDEGYILTKFISSMDTDNNIRRRNSNGDLHRFVDMINKFGTGDHEEQRNKIGWKFVDYGQFGLTEFNQMSYEGYSVLRQICKALDTNSQKQIKNIADRYKGSSELAEALKYFKSILEDHLLIGEPELASRLKLLNTFESQEWKPDLKFLIATYDDTALPIYGMNKDEFNSLYKIWSYKRAASEAATDGVGASVARSADDAVPTPKPQGGNGSTPAPSGRGLARSADDTPTPKPQGASGIVDNGTNIQKPKKTYSEPGTEIKSFEIKDDIMAAPTPKPQGADDVGLLPKDWDQMLNSILEPKTYEELYKDMAPLYKRAGFDETIIKKLNYEALQNLDSVGIDILNNPRDVNIILERIEQNLGKEVKDQIYDALMSSPAHRKTIITNAKGHADDMRFSTHNWNVEDTQFKTILKHVRFMDELNALKHRLAYDINSAPENLKPKYKALQKDLLEKENELAAKCYTHMDEIVSGEPLPSVNDFRKIIAKQIDESSNLDSLKHLRKDLQAYKKALDNSDADFSDIEKLLDAKSSKLHLDDILKNTQTIDNLEYHLKNAKTPEAKSIIARRIAERKSEVLKAYDDFKAGKSVPDYATTEDIVRLKIEDCKTLEDIENLRNDLRLRDRKVAELGLNGYGGGAGASMLNAKDKVIRKGILNDFTSRIERINNKEEAEALKQEFLRFQSSDNYYKHLGNNDEMRSLYERVNSEINAKLKSFEPIKPDFGNGTTDDFANLDFDEIIRKTLKDTNDS